MKPSSTSLFKSIASKIHPQVILSSKESSQFLGALTASFRQKLDTEHPHEHIPTGRTQTSIPLTLTERHVASVLTNPLLAHVKADTTPTGRRHPIDIFEHCVANGTASLSTAGQCLASFRRLLRNESKEAKAESITKYQPGTKVLQWLWANNLAQSDVFQHDQQLYKAVVFFLVKEGRSEIVRNWIESASEGPINDNIHSSPKSVLLDWLVTCEVKSSRKGFERALSTFLSFAESATELPVRYVHLAGSQLAGLARLQATAAPADTSLLSRFTKSYSRWQASASEPVAIDMSCLQLQLAPFNAIDTALALARTLSLQSIGPQAGQYGERPVQFLVQLSDAVQTVGSQKQARDFVQLLQSLDGKPEPSAEESLLAKGSRGVSSMLLREFDGLDFSARQIAV